MTVSSAEPPICPVGAAAARCAIWVDLDNSPHVPFFRPIVKELEDRGYSVFLTGRDCFQVVGLVELAGLPCKIIGRHWGSSKLLKLFGTCIRALQLARCSRHGKPHLAVSHGSRSQILASRILRIPSVMIDDYECSRRVFNPDWLMVPQVIPEHTLSFDNKRVLRYPGIKEDTYTAGFRPDDSVRDTLGLAATDTVVTMRPPASEAHYHNPESDVLYRAIMDSLLERADIKVVVLPRSPKQAVDARAQWKAAFDLGKFIIPSRAVDGLSLIWFSDLVISGGGTMNREAAALGVPVYSFFRGPIGAIDRYLAAEGKLVMVEKIEDIKHKVLLKRRLRQAEPSREGNPALETIVNHIIALAERRPGSLIRGCGPSAARVLPSAVLSPGCSHDTRP